jgi:hypothetical protein
MDGRIRGAEADDCEHAECRGGDVADAVEEG